ncbi:ABC transporter substrate-binding protein [Pseudonocardiaceae bacterium YIM PH 21723]|nr:ABC transporter substrate-binding protein [Pseudonocardiaceae bacterium YIM PH 21723]
MTIALAKEPATLNPVQGFASFGGSPLFDGLLAYDAERTLQPALASQLPQPSPDGRTWTVKLRDKVKFSDGSVFDAEDVVATYKAILDPATTSPLREDLSMITGVGVVDPLTVRFELAYPYAPLPGRLTVGILPSDKLTGDGPIGTGPYKVTDWRKGDKIELQANPQFRGPQPAVRHIVWRIVPDAAKRAEQIKNNSVDGAELPPKQAVDTEKSASDVQLIAHRTADFRAVALPIGNPVAGDRAVRQALNLAVNRQGLIDGPLAGKAVPATTPIPGVLPEFAEPELPASTSAGAPATPLNPYRYDKTEAGKILDQAGWTRTGDTRAKNGTPLSFSLVYDAGDSVAKGLADGFAKDAKAVGIAVTAEGVGSEIVKLRSRTDAVIIRGGDPFDPDFTSYPLLHTGGARNVGGYGNPEVDAALDAARHAIDPAVRVAEYRKFQRAYAADPAMVFLAYLNHTYLVRDAWSGTAPVVEPAEHGLAWGPWWNVREWTPKR